MARTTLKRSRSPSSSLSPLSSPVAASSTLTSTVPPSKDLPKSTPASQTLSKVALKKLADYDKQRAIGTPFPQWGRPTPEEAQDVCDRLASVHGLPQRPSVLVDREDAPAGCGSVPSVLDAVVRTCLSANTTSKNSTNAKRSIDAVYGRMNYRAVLEGGQPKLEETIRCGGLAGNKSKAIIKILERCEARNVEQGGKPGEGELSLDWIAELKDDDAAMKELLSFDSIGVKTSSCVLLFCLGRDSFAVDTHVLRISQSLGWLPPTGSIYTSSYDDKTGEKIFTLKKKTSTPPSRDEAFWHLDSILPNHLKYPLHSLLVRHGRGCVKCSANGVTTQDFTNVCPIEDLVSKKKSKNASGKGKSKAGEADEVLVKNEDGEVVGSASKTEKDEKAVFHPLEDAPVGELGKKAHEPVKLEEELGMASQRRSTRGRTATKRVKYEESDAEEEEQDEEEEDVKPTKRARRAPGKGKEKPLTSGKAGAKSSKRSVAAEKKKKVKEEVEHSVDRDEAEMSGRAWVSKPADMHGIEA
ncbi:hypothetical protein JCM8547_003872 [Rhodosporidiobolus lusitaniae]